ncbi:amylo-alpha-1,6-glucosidase [Bacillus sp. JCM 19034]|uniref:amylo-alpha-1,6-glucosidase n=1 Tax=Bacillus sp. JCM 19034 TaxID=1481928 RepID=UPI000784C06A|nr:amylo-alpha-1,6-glucosidase [Bacillus sp. JCM 19034]
MPTSKLEKHAIVTEGYWYEPVEYDISNQKLLAQFNGNIGISKYSIAGEWAILKDDSWFSVWSVNGKRLSNKARKKVKTIGRMMEIEYDSYEELDKVNVWAYHYCSDENALYIQVNFQNKGDEPAQVFLRHGMFLNIESYISSSIRNNGRFEKEPMQHSWNKQNTIWEATLGEDYAVHLATSHSAVQIEQEDIRMVLDYNDYVPPKETISITIAISGGSKPITSDKLIGKSDRAYKQAMDYVQWLKDRFISEHPILNSMFVSCLNAATSSYKECSDSFKAFYAGVHYQSPSRTYFRDGYWTILPLLPFKPDWVKREILTLAHGIGEDGSCPSAVVYNNRKNRFEAFWPDHYDSPSFFVMMVHDYLAWTHDQDILHIRMNEKTILQLVALCVMKLDIHTDRDSHQLVKPNNRRDWCDNVVRQGSVTYDQLLNIQARSCYAEILRFIGQDQEAEDKQEQTNEMICSLKKLLWTEEGYVNYINTSNDHLSEENISIEQALAVLFNIGSEQEHNVLLDKMTEHLETKNNEQQPYGDWGVMSVYPAYSHAHHLIEKSSYPFRYHNGSDWPYLSGVYAWAKLKKNRDDWQYPLTRWFTYSLEQSWLTPVEYYDPIFGKGSNLQGWSAMLQQLFFMED